MEKIGYLRFLPKIVTICSREKAEFDYKNNHLHNKLANFRLKIIGKINCKKPVVMLYLLSRLGSKNCNQFREPLYGLLHCYKHAIGSDFLSTHRFFP